MHSFNFLIKLIICYSQSMRIIKSSINILIVSFVTTSCVAIPAGAYQTTLSRISTTASGSEANATSLEPSISSNGKFVAFASDASNLVSSDTNNKVDIFLKEIKTNKVIRVSVASDGVEANNGSSNPAVSRDGRYITFSSEASNLVDNDTNNTADIFVYDTKLHNIQRITKAHDQSELNGWSSSPEISANGRFITYFSLATNAVPGDDQDYADIFLFDTKYHTTTLISTSLNKGLANGNSGLSGGPDVSDDGRFVVFESNASNLVPSDTNGAINDVFIRDTTANKTRLVSQTPEGNQGDSDSYWPTISGDGRRIAFGSQATNLITNDTNNVWDIYVRDFKHNTIERVSVTSADQQTNGESHHPDISDNGRYVSYFSAADNIVSGDSNLVWDVFAVDTKKMRTIRASTANDGTQGDQISYWPTISNHGNVAFSSDATTLVPNDTNNAIDIFLAAVK